MGNYRIVIEAVGGHGCQREVKDGENVQAFCGRDTCPDCAARKLVDTLCKNGENVERARLYHWLSPRTGEVKEDTVVDDLKSLTRHGSFNINTHKGESNIAALVEWDESLTPTLAGGGCAPEVVLPTKPPETNVGPVVDWDGAQK